MAFERSPQEIDRHVGTRLRHRRRELGISLERLADVLGLTIHQLYRYEKGINRISARRLWAIANALCVSIDYFYLGDPKDSDPQAIATPSEAAAEQMQFLAAYRSIACEQTRDDIFRLIFDLAAQTSGRPN